MWDHSRNEPVTTANTQDELAKLSAAAQRAELSGDTQYAEILHAGMNRELDVLDGLNQD
ncbi:hypothetical protein ACLVWQ_17630 (plasmid) [Streptomyces sp. CWNU-52B]|uniref:hypothetical protein n=1 Tax=unclassified Streptomyces TaxID=2593676 RepID=UPI0039C205A7